MTEQENNRLLTDKECREVEQKEGEYLNWCQPILLAQDAKTLVAVGGAIETQLMLRDRVLISGKTLTKVLKRLVEVLKQGRMPE